MKMGKIIVSVLVLLAFSGIASANKDIAHAHVEKNVRQYLGIVFGNKAPSLADYYKYENIHSEWEGLLEDKICMERWEGIQTAGCKQWLIDRNNHLKTTESLFYARVRGLVNFEINKKLELNIVKINRQGTLYGVSVSSKNSKDLVVLKMFDDPRIPELSYIRIVKLKNMPIEKIIGKE